MMKGSDDDMQSILPDHKQNNFHQLAESRKHPGA